jgi:hypothetical protein
MHERRFAGAIVPDKADAFAGVHLKIGAVKGAHGAEMLFDAGELDDICGCPGLHLRIRFQRR